MYRYQFTSTVDDLLEAEEIDRVTKSISKPLRALIAAIGIVWLGLAVIALCLEGFAMRILVWILISIIIIFVFLAKPYLRRRQIERNNARSQVVLLEFGNDFLSIHLSNKGEFLRNWDEFQDFADSDKGILFYFHDGIMNWLPNRVFSSDEERIDFIEFLRGKRTHGQ